MVQSYHPPVMDVNEDTIPELQPIFTFLNNHANKLYQEGYFLKLDDQNSQGRPNADRTWTECFAQLVGTVLSLWDAAELDQAGEHGEVLPKFINLTDASIKMIESLPTKSNDEQALQNILSISTAGRNRYLLHFNSHHSLIQWTAGIRLAMFEHSTLQEAYTGALIAGKGKSLNNINLIMDRAKTTREEWVRVRFGAGVPWRRCWCVISPPDEKEYQKQQKELKKRSPYDRSHAPTLKGDIKFYDSKKEGKKQKKAKPIASIADAYSAYAIYPQAKSLIDASTLIKIEGNITIHSDPPSSTEGFVFIMPETHPAVTGFEMLLRFLFPTWDTFGLYGRPGRLVASVLDPRSLMFGMPKHKKYGYLEILDVTSSILSEGSSTWSEREWRRRLKELTSARMTAMDEEPRTHSRTASRRSARLSIGPATTQARPRVNFADDSASVRSSRSMTQMGGPALRTDSAPPVNRQRSPPPNGHARNSSDNGIDGAMPFRGHVGFEGDAARSQSPARGPTPQARGFVNDLASTPERVSSEDEHSPNHPPPRDFGNMERMQTPEPVHAPPAFSHAPSSRPAGKPYHSPELRRANSRLSNTTLDQLAKAGGVPMGYYPDDHTRASSDESSGSRPNQGDPRSQAVHANASPMGSSPANGSGYREAMNSPNHPPGPNSPPGMGPGPRPARSPLNQAYLPPGPGGFNTAMDSPYQQQQQPYARQPSPYRQPQNLPPQGPPPGGPLPPGPPGARQGPGPQGPPFPGMQSMPVKKPLPQGQMSDPASQPESSAGSMTDYKLDNDGLAQVRPPPHRAAQRQDTQRSESSSNYDDASSTASPDYASTRSDDTQESVDRPRAGVLKTVGTEAQSNSRQDDAKSDYGIPEINFGPTINYASARAKTPTPLVDGEGFPPSPAKTPTATSHLRTESDDTLRRVAWSPGGGGAAANTSERPGALTPEQFVQQRAAAAPLYSHARSPSGNTLASIRATTPTPPLKRTSSHDMLSAKGGHHSRSNSADLLGSRPSSQGTTSALGMGGLTGSGDVSSHLSAREQEHVARVTGGPLIAMAGNRSGGGPQSAGLVGAIEAREREKQQIKQGVSSALVQTAINQRQQMQEREYRQQQQQQQQQMQGQQMQGQQIQGQFMPQQQQPQPMYGMGPPSGAPSMYGGSTSPGMRGPNSPMPSPMGPPMGSPMGPPMGSPMGPPMGSPMGPPMMGGPMGPPAGAGRGGYMPGPGYGPPQQRPPPSMHGGSNYGPVSGAPHPGGPAYAQGGGFSRPWPRQGGGPGGPGGPPPPPHMMQQQPQFVPGPGGFIPPPQGQRSPGYGGPMPGTPGTPGTPGNPMARGGMMSPPQQQQQQMQQQQQYQGQAF